MKKLLSILICVTIAVTDLWGQTITTSIKVSPDGAGVASVTGIDYNPDETTKQKGTYTVGRWSLEYDYYTGYVRAITGTITTPTNSTVTSYGEYNSWYVDAGHSNKFSHNAEAELNIISTAAGYYFDSWSGGDWTYGNYWTTDVTSTITTPTQTSALVDFTLASQRNSGSTTIQANFQKIISSAATPTSVTLRRNSTKCGTAQVAITLNKTEELEVVGTTGDLGITISNLETINSTLNASDNQSCTLIITANPGTTAGSGTITLKPKNSSLSIEAYNPQAFTITVNVEPAPIITFAPAAGGSYTYKQASANQVETVSNESKTIEPLEENETKVTLTPIPADGYYFYGWKQTIGETTTYLHQSAEPFSDVTAREYTFNTTSTVTAEFRENYLRYFKGPKVAYTSNSAVNGKVSVSVVGNGVALHSGEAQNTPMTPENDLNAIDLNNNIYSVKNTSKYSVVYKAEQTDFATFVGWFTSSDGSGSAVSTDLEYTCNFTNANASDASAPTPPTLYAKYESFYYHLPPLSFAEGSAGFGRIAVSADGNAPANQEDWKLVNIECDEVVQVATGGTSVTSKEITYYYHAQPMENTIFIGFIATSTYTEDETTVLESGNTYAKSETLTLSRDPNNPTACPATVYAVFQQNTNYYFKGAIAGFTENGEKGQLTVTGYTLNDNDEAEATVVKTLDGYPKESTEKIDDSGNTYQTELNVRKYKYTYQATDTDPDGQNLTAFKGWSRSPLGGTILSTENTYDVIYTTYATNEEDAAETAPIYAIFQSYWYKDPSATAVGGGQVAVTYSDAVPEENSTDWKQSISASNIPHQVAAENDKYEYPVWYHARGGFGTDFKGWAYVNDVNAETFTDHTANPYKVDYSVTATDDVAPFVPARLYAIFESVIKVIQQDRMIYHVDEHGNKNINDANVIINFNEAATLTATLKEEDRAIFQLSDKKNVQKGHTITLDASSGMSHMVVSYIGQTPAEHIGKTATITLSSTYTDDEGNNGTASIDVVITIEEKPFVTFLPTDGKGSYTIQHTDGRGIDYEMTKEATENIYVSVAQENMSTFELNLTEDVANDGLTFAGWQMIVNDVASYFSYDKKCTYTFKESAYVRPVFLADDRAVFTIDGDPTERPEYRNKYYDLQQALNDAKKVYGEKNETQVVVFSNEGKTEGTLYQGNYEIPAGVVLLIPGVGPGDDITMINEADEDKYVYRLKRMGTIPNTSTPAEEVLTTADYFSEGAKADAKAYRKLYVQDNTTFTVKDDAVLYLYASLNRSGQTYDARPYRYGQMILGENCQINVENGATLYAFGYITGASSSNVTAHSGAEVHEIFQYSDPRGGSGVAHLFLCRTYYKVFPFSQYYIQNVEVPMEIKGGATEYVTTSADVMSQFVLMTKFVIPETGDVNATGLFHLSANTSYVKYYDPHTDRLKIKIKGTGANSTARLGFIEVKMGDLSGIVASQAGLEGLDGVLKILMRDLGDVKLNSKEYVLPLNNNMDLAIENAHLTLSSSYAFLAGSTLTIDENSTMTLASGANMYVYDAEENNLPEPDQAKGYFGNENKLLEPIVATPNNTHKIGNADKRQPAGVKDAKWVINGRVIVQSGAGLYTTEHAAQIVSTKNGQVQFATSLGDGETYQAKYIGGGASNLVNTGIWDILSGNVIKKEGVHNRIAYPVTSAKLQNANGSYVSTNANTFTYNPVQGKWVTSTPATTTLQGADVKITMPDYNPATENVVDPYNFNVTSSLPDNVSSATIAWNGGSANNTTASKDAQGTHIALAYTPTNKAGEYVGLININNGAYYQRVNVTEDYTPRFSTIENFETVTSLGYSSEKSANIVPETNNVAGILSGKYKSTWTAEITGDNADEFYFEFGEGEYKLSKARIIFKPKTDSGGSKNAILSLTCSYTDAANVTHTTNVKIPLEGKVEELQPNTLAFADDIDSLFVHTAPKDLFRAGSMNSTEVIPEIEVSLEEVLDINQDLNTMQIKVAPFNESAKDKSVVVTVTQAADLVKKIAATTISKTITVTDDIVWNWKHLYFGTTSGTPYATPPVSHHEQITIESIEIAANHHYVEKDDEGKIINEYYADGDRHDVVQSFTQSENSSYNDVISIAGWEEGETQVYFVVSYKVGNSDETETKEFKSEVYRDPRYLPFTVNDDRIYEAVTWAQTGIKYADGDVTFTPTDAVAQWTFSFKGIPDLLTFNAKGQGKWQIEESHNGTNWSITHTWATIASSAPFEMELQPATRFVRISYGQGDVKGILSNVTVTELKSVRADVNKLYMPIISPNSSKNVVFTYVSEEGFTLETGNTDLFTTDPSTLPGLVIDPYYVIQQVNVASKATTEIVDALNVKGGDLTIPIQTFTFPQAIPIQLASDHQERYYYVTTNTYNTVWDMENRQIVMHNAVADASPYVVFHFADSPVPGIISFSYPTSAKGTWLIEESANGSTGWTEMDANEAEDLTKQFVMRDFSYPEASRYVRITYLSDYAEIIELSNLAILPTSNVTVNPSELIVYDTENEMLSVTANNIKQISFELPAGFAIVNENGGELNADALSSMFIADGTKKEDIYIKYSGTALATYGDLVISTTKDAQGADIAKKVLAVVHLTGLKKNLPVGASGIYTGTALDIAGFDKTKEAKRREINTQHAFAGGNALFDYVIIYGETTTTDEANTITAPTSTAGSNAQTPCYIYQKNGDNYELLSLVENANSSTKSWNGAMTVPDDHSLKVYITGFCPYASTGYSKSDEGVWYFAGTTGDKIDIYLEDCYLYSRYKSKRGNSFSRSNGESYSDKVARGSGAVLLFANTNKNDAQTESMDVTIHTRGTNLLKSHYGCLFESIVGRAFQISSPVQIYMQSPAHYNNSFSTLTFDDKWPTATTEENGVFTSTERTNGFLSLQKQVNNAPSIDMGNKKTVVNFRGGQIELQNALNSSDNYESTLAISYRTGTYGPAKFRFTLSHGIGTDGTEGTVNFYDGTTTVTSMTVPERYRQYYLMDENGTTTSCLRSQKNTFVYGGSHCMMRACPEPTDKGGAPKSGPDGVDLGLYQYPAAPIYEKDAEGNNTEVIAHKGGWTVKDGWENVDGAKLVTPKYIPEVPANYGVESITPNTNKTPDDATDDYLNLWVTSDFDQSVVPEVNNKISYWKACMTYIAAKYGPYNGDIGGMTEIAFNNEGQQIEEVYNLIYCEIDENIVEVIAATGDDQYSAPILNPAPTDKPDEKYMYLPPTQVGHDPNNPEWKNYITNSSDYVVKDRLYYIVPAQADVWMAFTAPFDVENIYIMETRHEKDLHNDAIALLGDEIDYRAAMVKSQAKHNADFAAFFGVALALESKKPFEDIFADYIGWAKLQDNNQARRNKYKLTHYYNTYDNEGNLETSNWDNADYYLYKNTGRWELTQPDAEGNQRFTTKWEFVAPPAKGEALLEQGETYSMLFPYCTGCGDDLGSRDYWDYWTGKFLIFESTDGGEDGHTIKGSEFVGSTYEDDWTYTDNGLISELKGMAGNGGNEAILTGNPTFAKMYSSDNNVWAYSAEFDSEGFTLQGSDIEPTQSFLYTNLAAITSSGQSLLGIGRDGTIRYGGNNNGNQSGTTGNMPTVGGGNDMFITAIEGGINIAVAAPQVVRVLSSTGSVIFAGTITTATDVLLPTSGIYIISGENEVQKVLY